MCAACGIATHVPEPEAAAVAGQPATTAVAPAAAVPRKFVALRNRDCRPYLFGAALAMMADNIEHVITYWALWQKFHSPALAGFEVISHWVPFLLFSVYFGALADRYDCRRVAADLGGVPVAGAARHRWLALGPRRAVDAARLRG
jgi:hypothetical protein